MNDTKGFTVHASEKNVQPICTSAPWLAYMHAYSKSPFTCDHEPSI